MSLASNSEAILRRYAPNGLRVSPAIAHAARKRLGVIALAIFVMTMGGYALNSVAAVYEAQVLPDDAHQLLMLSGSLLDVVMLILVYGRMLDDTKVLNAGYTYQVLRAATLSLSPTPEVGNISISWALVLVVLFPMLLPTTGIRASVAAVCAGLSQPLALLGLHFLKTPLPHFQILHSFFSSSMAIFFGLLGADLVRRYQDDSPRDLGSYDLVRKLGSGGMGEVWAAAHRLLARPAAIKLIPRKEESSATTRKKLRRFRREAQVTSNLTSPHTVAVFDYGVTEQGVYYYVMEYLDGLDLQHLVRKEGPVSPGRAVRLIEQACDSVGEAHAAGLVHRDLKPGNLFVVRQGLRADFLKVLDFGLVGLQSSLTNQTVNTDITDQGMMTGTPAYMSPEMVKGDPIDGRADIYALGCVLYFLVTGQLVFPGLRGMPMALAHAHEDPPHPSEIKGLEIPLELEELILRCLAKDPALRPQSALEFRDELRALPCYRSWTDRDASNWWNSYRENSAQKRMRVAVRRGEVPVAESSQLLTTSFPDKE